MALQQIHKVIACVNAAIDKRWLPEELQGKGIFSASTIWNYQLETGVTNCEHCKENENRELLGTEIRRAFPDLVVYDENYIWVNLHQTLWGKPTCKCFLYRAGLPALNPELVQAKISTLYGENLDE